MMEWKKTHVREKERKERTAIVAGRTSQDGERMDSTVGVHS